VVELRIFVGRSFLVGPDIRRFGNLGRRVCQFGIGGVFKQRDAFGFKRRECAVNLFGGVLFRGECVVHLIVEQIALLFAQFDEQPDLILLFLNFP
jgi:hypothetical protein